MAALVSPGKVRVLQNPHSEHPAESNRLRTASSWERVASASHLSAGGRMARVTHTSGGGSHASNQPHHRIGHGGRDTPGGRHSRGDARSHEQLLAIVVGARGYISGPSARRYGRDAGGGRPGQPGRHVADQRRRFRASTPAWCCSTANATGVTATGQGSARGSGPGARAKAIAKAIADAKSQAIAAAGAAGITLGRIIDIEVSAPFYAVPVESSPPAASGAPGNSGSGSAAPATTSPSISNPSTTTCPALPGCSYQASVSASVTLTWAIG